MCRKEVGVAIEACTDGNVLLLYYINVNILVVIPCCK